MPTYRLMEDHGGGKMSTHISEDQKERERKRTEAIAAKEQAREKREQARKGGKGGNGKSLKDDMAAKKEAELREKKDARANRIKESEAGGGRRRCAHPISEVRPPPRPDLAAACRGSAPRCVASPSSCPSPTPDAAWRCVQVLEKGDHDPV
jgi:hypothetical protein